MLLNPTTQINLSVIQQQLSALQAQLGAWQQQKENQ
jgi:hypothetical protein